MPLWRRFRDKYAWVTPIFRHGALRHIYTTFILGTVLLNFGTRADNFGHGPLDFCRVNAIFLARVPKNLGGLRPPLQWVPDRLKMGPRAQTRKILVPRAFGQMTDQESAGSGVEQQRQSFIVDLCAGKTYGGEKSWQNVG